MTLTAPPPSRASEASRAEPPSAKTMYVVPEWIEAHCVVPDGFRKGAPLKLYDYQLQYIAHFYMVRGDADWVPEQPVLAPAFVYRRGLLVGPQKLGKNPLIATQVCTEGVGPALFAGWAGKDDGWACSDHGCGCGWEYAYESGEPMGMSWPTPLIQITAFSEKSTENTYDALRPMIELGPLSDVIPKTGEEFIRLPGGGRIDTVTSSNQSRLGQRVTFVPQDELGLWTRVNKMEKVADTQYRNLAGMGGRASLTTNAWDPTEHSVAQREYESAAMDVYRQYSEPPKNLSYANKRERHKIHAVVYPPDTLRENGGHVDLNSIEGEAADLAAKDLPQAERFFGNRRVGAGGVAVDPDLWDELAKPRDVPAGSVIGLGFDGSISRDATVLRGCTPDGYSFLIRAWVNTERDPEWRVPRGEVKDTIAETFARYSVGRMFCDPPKWETEIDDWALQYGEEVVLKLDTNQSRRFAPAVDRWLTAIREGTHTHDGDELTKEHVISSHLRKARISDLEDDGRTRYVLIKGDEGRRIDAAVADVLAYEAAMTMPEDAGSPNLW
jgi:hypothetical protein